MSITLPSPNTLQPFVISDSPVTANATESAKKLYNFLKENFGKKTISGIMTGDINTSADILSQEDVKAVYTAGGHYPALIGFDFLFATGPQSIESWYQEYTNKTISLAEELWKKGGIPAFTWHWKDPSDQVDAFLRSRIGRSLHHIRLHEGFHTIRPPSGTASLTHTNR